MPNWQEPLTPGDSAHCCCNEFALVTYLVDVSRCQSPTAILQVPVHREQRYANHNVIRQMLNGQECPMMQRSATSVS
jgi:hypothetical protein